MTTQGVDCHDPPLNKNQILHRTYPARSGLDGIIRAIIIDNRWGTPVKQAGPCAGLRAFDPVPRAVLQQGLVAQAPPAYRPPGGGRDPGLWHRG